jgi:putative glycosyltransferase
MKLSIVATLYRSAPHLRAFAARIRAAADRITGDYEIILVNDGSPDESQEIAESICANDPRFGLIELSRNFGHHKAMMTGLEHAQGELVFLIDSDLEEEPELLGRFLDAYQSSAADVVYGVQQERRGNWFERLTGHAYYRLFNFLSDHAIPENVLTVRLMSRRYVRSLVRHREREICISGLWVLTGFRQIPLPLVKLSRSKTTYNLSRKLAVMVNHLTAYSNRPLAFIFYLGCFMLALSSVTGLYLIVERVFFQHLLDGWPSLMVSIWFLGGLTVFCMGVIGIYLAKLFSETKQRPYTIIRETYGCLAPVEELEELGRRSKRAG